MNAPVRCAWAVGEPLHLACHDEEWGVPVHDDRTLFELLILEGAQAGLSWLTVLRKRESYRAAYDDFDPALVALYTEKRQQRLLANPGIVRNRQKVAASVGNAGAFLALAAEHGSFARFLWDFAGGAPRVNRYARQGDVPAQTELSAGLSKELQHRGMKFVGSTILYAYLQAVGVVNDHLVSCFRYGPLACAAALKA